MAILLLACCCADNGLDLRPVVEERCEQVEHNFVGCRRDGKVRLEQLIFWGGFRDLWHEGDRGGVLPATPSRRSVAVVHDFAVLGGRPWTASSDARGVVLIRSRGPVLHKVRSPLWLRSFTFHDPEIENRGILPLERRRRLVE